MNSTKARKWEMSGTKDEAYDVDVVEWDERDSDAAELSWKDIQVTLPDGKKVLLSEACGRVKGRFLAIVGPSGAGKVGSAPLPLCLGDEGLFAVG
jgi:ABC-type transport system involved in cytochrome bd biosynthesis fused ATPase/permease subunit